jgi:hypothetical protein
MLSFWRSHFEAVLDAMLFSGCFMTKLLRLYIVFMTFIIPSTQAVAGKFRLPPAPAAMEKSYFFATRRACAGSGQFSNQECADAFVRVDALLHERAQKFADKFECVLKFKLCDREADGYLPSALGVEIVRSPKGLVALPMLAVETPRAMLRDPAPPPPAGEVVADAGPQTARSGNRPISPYGALSLQATSLAPVSPPSLKSYRRFVEEVQLRLAVYQQGARPKPDWRAER